MAKKYLKIFGKAKDNLNINATTWNGKNRVLIITPTKPSKRIRTQTENFILDELDDHDAFSQYKKHFLKK
jgi:hypothetical protein